MLRHHATFAVLFLAAVLGCSSTDEPGTPGGAGVTTAGSGGGGAAGASSAGAPPSAGAAPTPTAGAPGNGAGGSGGGALGGAGASNGGAGAAGSSTSGAGGGTSGGAAGAAGGGSTGQVMPSAGCGKSGRPANGKITVANQEIIDFPASYDGTKPFPLLIALHACGNPNTQWEGLVKGSAFETEYVRLMPNTSDSGQCWSNYNNNIARILKQYDDVLANYCIDTSHVFGVGHSSGAQMLVNTLSHKSDAQHLNFRAVSPVAADPFNVAIPIPVLYIDGIMDNQRSADSAKNAVAKFRAANMCADTFKTYTPIMGCTSSGMQVDPGCKIYDNCTKPTIWCAHNDPNYSGTQHGVPCFGIKAIYDFFKTI
ncbi:MAG: hypothetical protein ABUL62_14530 [Myxococcales bacterium]